MPVRLADKDDTEAVELLSGGDCRQIHDVDSTVTLVVAVTLQAGYHGNSAVGIHGDGLSADRSARLALP